MKRVFSHSEATVEFMKVLLQPLQCLRVLTMSSWNPPPGNRKMHGDLMYLNVLTMEDKELNITSSTRGFYLNQWVLNCSAICKFAVCSSSSQSFTTKQVFIRATPTPDSSKPTTIMYHENSRNWHRFNLCYALTAAGQLPSTSTLNLHFPKSFATH